MLKVNAIRRIRHSWRQEKSLLDGNDASLCTQKKKEDCIAASSEITNHLTRNGKASMLKMEMRKCSGDDSMNAAS